VNECWKQTLWVYIYENVELWKSNKRKKKNADYMRIIITRKKEDWKITGCACMHVDIFTFVWRIVFEWLKLNNSGWEKRRGRTEWGWWVSKQPYGIKSIII